MRQKKNGLKLIGSSSPVLLFFRLQFCSKQFDHDESIKSARFHQIAHPIHRSPNNSFPPEELLMTKAIPLS